MNRAVGILSLDLSLRVGWAYGRGFDRPLHGVWALGKTADLGRVFSGFAGELESAIAVHSPDLIIMEAPLPPQAQTAAISARLQFGLAAICEMIASERGVRCEEEAAHVVRKLVFGRARVEKETVVQWCREQGWQPADHNDADALALLRYRQILARGRVTAGAGSAAA